jgi:acyl-CoA synthetase (AMP-forming)/AMP-acid ligase II
MSDADLAFLHQPDTRLLLDDLADAVRSAGEDAALHFGSRELSYSALEAAVSARCERLQGEGLSADSRVLLLLPNGFELVWNLLALLRLGATVAPIEIRTAPETVAELSAQLRPSHVIALDTVRERAEAAAAGAGRSVRLLEEHLDGPLPVAGGPAPPVRGDGRLVFFRRDRDDRWRGAWFDLPTLRRTVRTVRQLFSLHRGDAVLCHMPGAHYLSLTGMILPALCSGARLVLLDRSWDDEVVLDAIEAWRPKLMMHYRKYYWYLLRSAQRRVARGHSLGRILHAVVNADSPSLPFRDEWEELFDGHLLPGFATTFAAGFLSLDLPWLDRRPGLAGKPLPGVDLRILDESGAERPFGRWGEIVYRSPGMAGGFLDEGPNPERCGEGWLRTQQMASLDTDGFVALADEVFDVIWVHGFKVSPLEVEEPLLALPGIIDCAAVNAPRGSHADRIQVFVVQELDEEGRPSWSVEGLLAECERLFPPYLRPALIQFVDEVPYDDEEFKLRKDLKHRYQSADSWRIS